MTFQTSGFRRSASAPHSRVAIMGLFAALEAVSGCSSRPTQLSPLPPANVHAQATPRINAALGSPVSDTGFTRLGSGTVRVTPSGERGAGDISLAFSGTDIHAVTEEILGSLLHVNYTIDAGVQGTATLHTAQPLRRDQLIPTLKVLLSGAGAALVIEDGLYRVVSLGHGGPAGASAAQGEVVIPMRYANADSVARLVQRVVTNDARVVADPASNTIVISGDVEKRATLAELVRSFDTDAFAGQSYALLPAGNGTAAELAGALQSALGLKEGESTHTTANTPVQIFPMPSIDSILVVARQPRQIQDVRRAFSVIEAARRQKTRSWNVVYLQNGRANDVAYVLQQAFTPNHVTATPTPISQIPAGMTSSNNNSGSSSSGSFGNMSGASGIGSSSSGGSSSFFGNSSGGTSGGGSSSLFQNGAQSQGSGQSDGISNNPLLAGLGNMGQSGHTEPLIRIIPDMQNNSILVYGTQAEAETVSAMLRKIDITPVQVRVDVTVAEVQLNDALQYGTQFFFKSGGVNGILSGAQQTVSGTLASSQLSSSFPGFVIGGSSQGGAPFVIDALQNVTTVRVLSTPQLMVIDNQPASLMVGNLVPYLTGTTTSAVTSDSTITNSVSYQPTGVILQVTPHVSNTGLVTLDVSQQVSSVSASGSTAISSPTFSERQVTSRVAIEDGQTVGLAGLISENASRNSAGIPWLKDIPVLGFLGSTQNNTRVRTELLVMITPHVIHNQDEARAMTEDLRHNLQQAAVVAPELYATQPTGSADPQRRVLHAVGLND
ncbi:type II secretion system secretin GspD [Gluconobacter sp. Dm-62]|uniref:type II secretion system secretin GspD n=1 Tax=Gluconobacter sp. Dm-62 TaxID=2799804 RepID=UPI001B8D1079|nr:type II secretion system secretin GspD [Gluconobacter sp. Dm-62]MBS1103331.1 type II secretion system secretin GspD [Gluconobacter sp. Dm-62]